MLAEEKLKLGSTASLGLELVFRKTSPTLAEENLKANWSSGCPSLFDFDLSVDFGINPAMAEERCGPQQVSGRTEDEKGALFEEEE